MKENVSENVKKALEKFDELSDSQKLYQASIILNHLDNGLINDGNYLSEDEALENDKDVLFSDMILLDDPMKLATNLLVIGTSIDNITVQPNGIDIEPYIKDIEKLPLKEFYQLSFKDKIDYLAEMFYEISIIEKVKQLGFEFNMLIKMFLDVSNEYFGTNECSIETD